MKINNGSDVASMLKEIKSSLENLAQEVSPKASETPAPNDLSTILQQLSIFSENLQDVQDLLGKSVQNADASLKAPKEMKSPISIEGSVGRRGTNSAKDVLQVQQALVQRGFLQEGEYTPGKADDTLFKAIEQYQRDNKLPYVDGRIDVGKNAMKALNGEATTLPSVQMNPTVNNPRINRGNPNLGGNTVSPPGNFQPREVSGPMAEQQASLGANAVAAAQVEADNNVREVGRTNKGARVDQYANNAGFNYNSKEKGGEWCGFFTEFALTQAGFKRDPGYKGALASYQKARDFFMYRSYTDNKAGKNQSLDSLRQQQEAGGSKRQYFMLPESKSIERIQRQGSFGTQKYGDFIQNELPKSVFNYQNLPVQGGDVVLFHHGHVGLVKDYNPATGLLTTIEGNVGSKVVTKTYDLSDPSIRSKFDGFGRPSRFDYE